MARDEFFRDVRRALLFMAPRVESDSASTNPDYIARMLQSADLWLTPKVVEAFAPEDFRDLADSDRQALERAVQDFIDVAKKVRPHEPARKAERDAAIPPFLQIVQPVQKMLRDDWLAASNNLLNEAEKWAKELDWPTKRYPKESVEDFIGAYRLDKLVFSAEGSQLALVPVGRFAPATDGMFDLAVLPSYDSNMVVRQRGRWYIHPLPNDENRRDWSKEAFVETSIELARLP